MALRDTLDELQASAGARAVPMSLLHLSSKTSSNAVAAPFHCI